MAMRGLVLFIFVILIVISLTIAGDAPADKDFSEILDLSTGHVIASDAEQFPDFSNLDNADVVILNIDSEGNIEEYYSDSVVNYYIEIN